MPIRSLNFVKKPCRTFSLKIKNRDASSGVKVSATIREMVNEKQIVTTISLNSSPAKPGTNNTGTKTASVVKVEAVIAIATSVVPFDAASLKPSPSSRWRKTLSSTTIELSTSMPIDNANPAIEIIFNVRSA